MEKEKRERKPDVAGFARPIAVHPESSLQFGDAAMAAMDTGSRGTPAWRRSG